MSEWFFDHGCGEGFTVTVYIDNPTQIFISCALEGGHAWDNFDVTEVLKTNAKIRQAFKDCIYAIESEMVKNERECRAASVSEYCEKHGIYDWGIIDLIKKGGNNG